MQKDLFPNKELCKVIQGKWTNLHQRHQRNILECRNNLYHQDLKNSIKGIVEYLEEMVDIMLGLQLKYLVKDTT